MINKKQMKTIGLIGGMNWKTTSLYYQIVNEIAQRELGALHSGKLLIYSFDFEEMFQLQEKEMWPEWERRLCESALRLERAGAELIVMCCNTAHKAADAVQRTISIPLLHIADAVGEKVADRELTKIGLLGTNFTMEEDFYKNRLKTGFGLNVLVPDKPEREQVHRIIFEELEMGVIKKSSKKAFLSTIDKLIGEGAQGIVLGCTEISLLIKQEDVEIPIFDTINIHAAYACKRALG
jgi:aspartate racemase